MQFVNIKDSTVTFANPDNDPAKKADQLGVDLGALLLESAQDKATILQLEDTVGNLLYEVATLKGGAE